MKKTMLVLAGCATLLLTVAFAQDEHELTGTMKTAAASSGALRKSVAAKDEAATVENAEKLEGAFKAAQSHFEEHHMDDGVNFAKTGHQAAMDVAAAAKAGDWDKAAAEMKTVGAQCQGCHAAHREKLPDGTFKMK